MLMLLCCACTKSGDNGAGEDGVPTDPAKYSISKEAFDKIKGDYDFRTSSEGSAYDYMACYIGESEGTKFLTIYDTVGNPGVEGPIVHLSDDTIIVDVDYDYYEQMPASDWELRGPEEDGELVLSYKYKKEKSVLSDGKKYYFMTLALTDSSTDKEKVTVTFRKENEHEHDEHEVD